MTGSTICSSCRTGTASSQHGNFGALADHGAEGLGRSGEGHVAVPAGERATLEVAQDPNLAGWARGG